MTTQTEDWVGLTLDGRYTVTGKLGEGGMGFVYRAKDSRLNCDVVVKVPRAAMLEDAGFRERFRAEVGALVRLAHPHVVKVSDFGQHAGVPFAVMQFLPGGSLEDRRPKDATGQFKRVASRSLGEWILPVAEALDFIHKQGYVHRDVKPANILFDAYKNPYISDFGVAKAVAGNKGPGAGITGTGLVLGTPTYMAPELVLGKPFDGRIDQYALAVTVFELLVGHPPFEGPTPMAVLVKRTTDRPPTLISVRPSIAAGISDAVAKALSKESSDRFPSCAAFAKAILSASEQAAVPARTAVKLPTAAIAPSPKRETPRSGTKAGTVEEIPVAAVVDDPPLKLPTKTKPPARPASSKKRTALIVVSAAGGGVLLAFLIGLSLRLGNVDNTAPAPTQATRSAIAPPEENPRVARKHVSARQTAPAPAMMDLRPRPATVVLRAGGGWVPVDVMVERAAKLPVTVELQPPPGVRVRPGSQSVTGSRPVRFELQADAATVSPKMSARLSIAGTAIGRDLRIELERADFRASVIGSSVVAIELGSQRSIELAIDRSAGYSGPLIVSVPGSDAIQAATIETPDNASTAKAALELTPNARPGSYPLHIRVASPDNSVSNEVAITVHVAPAIGVKSFAGHKGKVTCVSLSRDGRLALSGGEDGTVRLWDLQSGAQQWVEAAHRGSVLSVTFSADGLRAMSGGADNGVRLYDVPSGKMIPCTDLHKFEVWLVRFVNDVPTSTSGDKEVRWADNGIVRVKILSRDPPRQKPETTSGHRPGTKPIPTDNYEFFLSGTGTSFATLFHRGATNAARPIEKVRISVPGGSVKELAASGDGTKVLTVSGDNAVRLWDTSAAIAKALPGYPWTPQAAVTCAALDGGGGQLLLGQPDGTLKLWRLP